MLETLKKWGTGLVLKTKDLFTPSESQVYVKDLRKVMTYDGRKCQYPENYDEVVKSGKIKKDEDSGVYELRYDGNKYDLTPVLPPDKEGKPSKIEGKSYFTIDFLVNPKKNKDVKHYDGYYKPFGFSKIDLEKHLPVFEVDTKLLRLTNSSFLAKKGCFINDDTGEVDEKDRDEKGRNGELLYTSNYKKLSTHFSEIRDQNGNLELDKSLISVPIVFATSLAKVCTKLLTSPLMQLGEYLISKENPIAKSFGYLLFTPAAIVKNSVNMVATILKFPILLFVANEKKYGDAYLTMWKHQLEGCWEAAKSDFNIIKGGERLKPEQKDHKPRSIVGTWKELDARRPDIEKDLEKGLSKSSESIDKSREPDIGKSLNNESIAESRKKAIAQEKLSNHAEKITQGRQAATNAPSRSPH